MRCGILGRPDSFFSQDEEDLVFDSILENSNMNLSKIVKVELELFNEVQIKDYLQVYIYSHCKNATERDKLNKVMLKALEKELDIISRPVQLSMFTKLMNRYVDQTNVITRYMLYRDFVHRFVRREEGKLARKIDYSQEKVIGFDDPRSEFMQNVAWWVLIEKKENRFQPSEIPKEYIPASFRDGKSADAVLREYLVGSVIERSRLNTDRIAHEGGALAVKGGGYFYFPHKSYLEFLVAEYFGRARFSKPMYQDFLKNLNPEILSFLSEGPNQSVSNLRQGLEFASGPVARELIIIAQRDPFVANEFSNIENYNLSNANMYMFYEYALNAESIDVIERFVTGVSLSATSASRFANAVNILLDFFLKFKLERVLGNFLSALLENIGPSRIVGIYSDVGVDCYHSDTHTAKAVFLTKCLEISKDGIIVNVRECVNFINASSFRVMHVVGYSLIPPNTGTRFKISYGLIKPAISEELWKAIQLVRGKGSFLRLHGDADSLFRY